MNIFRSAPASPADDDPTTGLEVDGVSFAYNDHLVLDDVSLDVASGEILALLGPSGCGKTTLLRSIAGLDRPRTGSIRLGGRTLTDHRTSVSPERRRIGEAFGRIEVENVPSWRVETVNLMKSTLMPTGAVYTVLAKISLA